jgi:aminopeptidase N
MIRTAAILTLVLLFEVGGWADAYIRQPSIDVIHYDIAVELSDQSDSIVGTTKIQILLRAGGVSHIWLDFTDMEVRKLLVGGRDRPFVHEKGRLQFDFDRPYSTNEIAEVEIQYDGQPKGCGMLIGKNRYGRRVFFAENWPDHAHCWFPSIDHPSDKATVDFSVTAPDKYMVVANGSLKETGSLTNGRKLTRWSERKAIPTYCMVIGAAEFIKSPQGNGAGTQLDLYYYREDADTAVKLFDKSSSALRFFSDLIGPYPYEKLAQIQSTTQLTAMENSSSIFYSEDLFIFPSNHEGVVAHEIAHQWFGDSITPSDWDHVWLSEGFATYLEWLFFGSTQGIDSFKKALIRAEEQLKNSQFARSAVIIDPELKEPMKKLNILSYQKGAWVLHMLRGIMGDKAFFRGIRRYYRLYESRNVITDDFRKTMETESGISLQDFFRQWLYQPGWPDLQVNWRWDASTQEAVIIFHQIQKTGLFDMPVQIAFITDGNRKIYTIRLAGREQTCRIPLHLQPSSIEIDPDGWILKSLSVVNE